MSLRIFLLLSLIFAFLQGSFLPPVFLEGLLVVIFVLANQSSRIFPGLLVSGLIFDLAQSNTLGVTSALFVVTGAIMVFLKQDIPFSRPWVGAVVGMLILLARSKIVFASIDVAAILAGGLAAFFVLGFARLSKSDKLEI